MLKQTRKIKNRIIGEQSGQILIWVLIIFILGSLMIPPLLALMTSGLITNQVYDDNTNVIYSADSGIEDAKWKIQYDKLTGYSPFNFTTPFTYTISDGSEIGENINQYSVDVSIQNTWILGDYISTPTESEAAEIVNLGKLVVVGTTSDTGITVTDPDTGENIQISQYKIKVNYTYANQNIDALQVDSIGVWLPSGYEYFSDPDQTYSGAPIQSQLEDLGAPYEDYQAIPQIVPSNGNQMIVWDYDPLPSMSGFPPSVVTKTNYVMIMEFTFFYRPLGNADAKPDAVAWIKTAGASDVSYAWNADVRVFQILSTADNTTIESYMTKSELRTMSSSVAGDYYATGNTLMRNAHSDSGHIRDTWLNSDHSSSAVVMDSDVGETNSNPTEISGAYLFWTAWKDIESMTNLFSDDCADWSESETSSSEFQTRVPTGDGDASGIWNTTPLWNDVDETTANDSDYMTGSAAGASVNTGWINPSVNISDTGGDGDGFELAPENAYIDGSGNAANGNGDNDRHRYSGYNVSGIPSGVTILGIEVRLDWWMDSTNASSDYINVDLSWDGGTSWTSSQQANNDRTSDGNPTDTLGSSSDLWGRTSWTAAELANLVVRLTCNSDSSSTDFFLDWLPVCVTYANYTATSWINPSANNSDTGGDGNGFEVAPGNAYTDGGGNAANMNGDDDRHRYSGYDLSSIPSGSGILGIEVRLDWWMDSTSASSDYINVDISWDGGTSWTTTRQADNDRTSDGNPTDTLGSSSDLWGRTSWTTAELANLVVRLTCNSGSSGTDFYVDWLPIRVTYTSDPLTGQQLFNFNPFTIPTGQNIEDMTLYIRAADTGAGISNIIPTLKIGDNYYTGTVTSISSTNFSTSSYSWSDNPATGDPWTVEDINGTGPNPLRQIGVSSSDLNPSVRVSMVYARVNFGYISLWSVIGNRYQGQGAASANEFQRTLTLRNSLDFSSYHPGMVDISWDQSESGNLEETDYLAYAFSGDNGNTWGDYEEAFHNSSPPSPFSIVVPDEYLTTGFKIRFFFNFDDSSEFVWLDNINISSHLFIDDCDDFINWDQSSSGSRWSIRSSDEFMGTGSASATTDQRTLTLNSSIDLGGYDPGTVSVMWEQETQNLESSDQLFFAFYDSDSGWSNDIESLHGNSPNSLFGWQIPTEYLSSSFKMRFYFNSNSSNEYIYIDNICLALMAPDKSVVLKINEQQVYFNGADPATGAHEIVASKAEIIPNITSSVFKGFSYSCYRDVTALVREYTRIDAGQPTEHSPGIGTYTVGNVDATLGIDGGDYQLAHAGWSLILVYTSQNTVGHQLYLYDRFTYADDYTDIDFDRDGQPGGDISGFIVPERIEIDGVLEETVARMTVFVGEGDEWIEGDFVAFQAPENYWNGTLEPEDIPDSYKLWDGISADGNSSGSPDNVWNGMSTVFSADGVDIDTIEIPWDDGSLDQGDTQAHIDVYTDQDNWNMVYLIISFRSKTTYGGTLSYLIRN